MEAVSFEVQDSIQLAYGQTQIRNLTDGVRTVRPARPSAPNYDIDTPLESLWPEGWTIPEWIPEVLQTKEKVAENVRLAALTSPVAFACFEWPHSYLGTIHRLLIVSKVNAFVIDPTNPDTHEPLQNLFGSTAVVKLCYRGGDQQKWIERDFGVIPTGVVDIETIRLHTSHLPCHASPIQIRNEFSSTLELPLGFPHAVPPLNDASMKAVAVTLVKLWEDISQQLLKLHTPELRTLIQNMLNSTHEQTEEQFRLIHFFTHARVLNVKDRRIRTSLISVARQLNLPTTVFSQDYAIWRTKTETEFLRGLLRKVRSLPRPAGMDPVQHALIVPRLAAWWNDSRVRPEAVTRPAVAPRWAPYQVRPHLRATTPTDMSPAGDSEPSPNPRTQDLEKRLRAVEQQPLDLSCPRAAD